MKDSTRERLIRYSLPYDNDDRVPVNRDKLGPFVNGYIAAALWSSTDPFEDNDKSLEDLGHTVESIAEPTLLQMIRDCVMFYWRCRAIFDQLWQPGERVQYKQGDAGHDFWLSRNGHGSGFFDRGWEPHWDILQNNAKGFGEFHLWVNEEDEVEADFTRHY